MRETSLFARLHPSLVRTLWIAYWVALFCLMHIPKDDLPDVHISNLDKVVHLTGYALLGLLCGGNAQRRSAMIDSGWYVKWACIFATYAAFDELTQPLVNRTAGLDDWVADMLGIAVAFAVLRFSTRSGHIEPQH